MLQNATPLKKSAAWPPNISDEHVSCTAPAMINPSFQVLFKCPTPAIVFGNATKPSRFAHFWHLLTRWRILCACHTKRRFNVKSGANMWCFDVLCAFWLRNVLRATTAYTFHLKSAPRLRFFCFAPQGRATFHLSSDHMAPHQRAYFSTLRSHKSLEKHSVSRLSYLFAHLDLLSSEFLFLDLLSSSRLFSDSSHLCFSICPYCRKFDF